MREIGMTGIIGITGMVWGLLPVITGIIGMREIEIAGIIGITGMVWGIAPAVVPVGTAMEAFCQGQQGL
jgi:hypothetical protein